MPVPQKNLPYIGDMQPCHNGLKSQLFGLKLFIHIEDQSMVEDSLYNNHQYITKVDWFEVEITKVYKRVGFLNNTTWRNFYLKTETNKMKQVLF